MNVAKFNCPQCKQTLEAPESLLGTVIECPVCKTQLKLSAPAPQQPNRMAANSQRKIGVNLSDVSAGADDFHCALCMASTVLTDVPIIGEEDETVGICEDCLSMLEMGDDSSEAMFDGGDDSDDDDADEDEEGDF